MLVILAKVALPHFESVFYALSSVINQYFNIMLPKSMVKSFLTSVLFLFCIFQKSEEKYQNGINWLDFLFYLRFIEFTVLSYVFRINCVYKNWEKSPNSEYEILGHEGLYPSS